MKNRKFGKDQNGTILLAIIIMMPFFMLIAASYLQLAVNNYRVARTDQFRTHAQFATDAGVDASLETLNLNTAWAGTAGEVEIPSSGDVRRTYETIVTMPNADKKIVTSIGRTYSPASATTPTSTIKVDVELRPIRSGEYSVVSGVGGLNMSNSAKIVNGSVYVNGKLTMSNTAQIGLLGGLLPVDVKVAHQSCPTGSNPGPTYPHVCGPGNGQPITINNSARIYGKVLANNQTSGTAMSSPGLCASTNPSCASEYPVPAVSLPDYDRNAQKAAVQHTINASAAGCPILGLGVNTWQANTKINGNVNLSGACIVTVNGNVWITGNFNISNLAQLVVNPLLTEPPVIMIDGSNGFNQSNGATLLPSLALKGFKIITYANATGNPDAIPTGTSLYQSQSINTINLANTASGLQTEYYARWSKITVANSGAVGAIAGQTVDLTNTAAITLGTSVSGFGNTVWVINSYKRSFE